MTNKCGNKQVYGKCQTRRRVADSEGTHGGALTSVRTPLCWSNKPVLPATPDSADRMALPALRRQTGNSLGSHESDGWRYQRTQLHS